MNSQTKTKVLLVTQATFLYLKHFRGVQSQKALCTSKMAIVKQHLPRHPHRHFHAMQRRLQSEELTQEMKLSQQGRLNAQSYSSHIEHSFKTMILNVAIAISVVCIISYYYFYYFDHNQISRSHHQ